MRPSIRLLLAGVLCAASAVAIAAIVRVTLQPAASAVDRASQGRAEGADATSSRSGAELQALPRGTLIDTTHFEDGGVGLANFMTGPVHDPMSLRELRAAVQVRGKLALSVLRAKLDQLHIDAQSTQEDRLLAVQIRKNIGLLLLYEGQFKEASRAFEEALDRCEPANAPARARTDLIALCGIAAMRRGEIENCVECVGPSSCLFPIAREAVHQQPAGSSEAAARFTEYLHRLPGDLRVRWLLNLVDMTLGDYPEKVPPLQLVPLDAFKSERAIGRFENVAMPTGLTVRGPNLAGGSVFDDFNGDGRPDLLLTSLDADRGATLFINRGDGTFEDRSDRAGLSEQVYVLNVTRADIDNDGDLDVLFLRGAWESRLRLSLLRNRGDGTFDDITSTAGLAEPISSESAAWGDYDNDGLVDLFISGEFWPPSGAPSYVVSDAHNRCRLYHNEGNGTFRNVAESAGVAAELCSKGSAWGDYDGDGWLDLYVSNFNGPSQLYHNDGDGSFHDVAPKLGVTGSNSNFAVWFWDYDNDGRLDLYVNDNSFSVAETVATFLNIPAGRSSHPRLYRNLGADGFRDVSVEAGLDRALTPMGCNFGDIDNDGFLDVYIGTGGMSYEFLVPNVLFHNREGERFEDVTVASGTGHLQKGHGVSFADYDGDGDLDLFVELGGAVPGDRSHNALFRNPLTGRHWLKLKLAGTKTNRAALGARIRVTVKNAQGLRRSIYRTVGNNSSFGGNSLVELVGLGVDERAEEVEIAWPTSRTRQRFRDVAADRTIEVTEGSDTFRVVDGTKPASR